MTHPVPPDWRKLVDSLHTRYPTTSLTQSAQLAIAIAAATDPTEGAGPASTPETAGGADSASDTESASGAPAFQGSSGSPEVRLGGTFVDVKVESAEVAELISRVAADLGLRADPSQVAKLEVGLDTSDRQLVGPFWAAILTGDAKNFDEIEVRDPTGRFDVLWFQRTDAHETPRQRFHYDLWLPVELVPDRIEAAVAAGGTVVSTDEAPAFTVLADPEGNKVCICTSEGRG